MPSSSELATIGRGERSPSATAFVPSANSKSGLARSVARKKALAIAAKIVKSKVRVNVTK